MAAPCNIKLDFCFVGPQRTGTSWIDKNIRKHPEILLPEKVKETYFFEEQYPVDPGRQNDLYRLRQSGENIKIGEVSPTYFHQPEVIERIREHNPDCKIIITVRDPVDRAISLFRHHVSKGRISRDFREAIEQHPQILEAGHYAKYIPMWQARFQKENVHILPYDQIAENPQWVVDRISEILGCSPLLLEKKDYNPYGSSTYPKFPFLAKIFAATARKLRAAGLHSVAEFGKRIGLKKVYAGGEKKSPEPEEEDYSFLRQYYQADYAFLQDPGLLAKPESPI